jgi:hypothetical protein
MMAGQFSRLLRFCAVNGRWILVFSLVVGLLSETLANIVKPHIEAYCAFNTSFL